MVDDTATETPANGAICPNCGRPLRDSLQQEQLLPKTGSGSGVPRPIQVVFCGSCGWTLGVVPGPMGMMGPEEVETPKDEESLEGQFQMRCRELISETRALGFNPNVWVSMINRLGAVETAKKLLADHNVLVATPWLVARRHPELTIEHEINQARWSDVFSDEERAERRLDSLPPADQLVDDLTPASSPPARD